MSQGKVLLVLVGILVVVVSLLWLRPDAADQAKNDEVLHLEDDDPAMQAAYAKARNTLDHFLALAASPPPDVGAFAVKVSIAEGDYQEHFWVTPFEITKDGTFLGQIGNRPRIALGVAEADYISFRRADVVDWTYRKEGKMHGNFTACARLSYETDKNAARFREQYGLTCEI